MRILFVYHGWNSGTNQALVNAWRNAGPTVDFCECDVARLALGPFRRRFRTTLGRLGLGRTGNATYGQIVRSQWYQDRMKAALMRPGPAAGCDVALAFGTTIPVGVLSIPYFLYTDHTILTNLYYPGGLDRVRQWDAVLQAERRTIEGAMRVFTMSEHVGRSFQEHYGLATDRIVRVGVGCNIPDAGVGSSDRYVRQNVLFVGVDWERKGGPDLLDAFTRVRRNHPAATLTIVGCRPRVKAPGVRVLGPVSQGRTSRLLAEAAVFCLPSGREPFGIAFLEALRAGAPVIGLDLGATPDFIIDGKTGYRVPPGDVPGLADRLDRLLSDPVASRRMGERGRKLVQRWYRWDRVQQRMAKTITGTVHVAGRERAANTAPAT